MASTSGNRNPNVVKTALDEVFYAEFDRQEHPGVATALTDRVFKQSSTDKSAVIMEVFEGTGLWDERAEEEAVHETAVDIADKITFSVSNYDKTLPISKNYFDDDQHDSVQKMVADLGETGRITRDTNGFSIYRGAFDSTTTADGSYLCSNTHTNLAGNTVDNLLTSALTPSSLKDALVMLGEQEAQDGTIRGHVPAVLLVPMDLFKEASEIVESEHEANTADNQINVYSSKFNIYVQQSPYLGDAAGGDDDDWFLLSRNHTVYRWERQPVETVLVDWKYDDSNRYKYKGEYREVVGAITYDGLVGSNVA